MIEVTGNLWTYSADIRLITTNGFVKTNGCAVMGRGCAYEASKRYPKLPLQLGSCLRTFGNHVEDFIVEYKLLTFPVKHKGNEKADLDLIAQSTDELHRFVNKADPSWIYVLPRPGCGNGQLSWQDVKPIVNKLPDNIHIITFGV